MSAPQVQVLKTKLIGGGTQGLEPSISTAHACLHCVYKTRTCGSAGPVDSPFVIVGESPGKQEAVYNRPFIGESGALLNDVLSKLGYDVNNPDNIQPYLTNAIKCLPPKEKDQAGQTKACHACRLNLMQEIMAYPRKVILALGAPALWSLTGDFRLKVTQVRGQIFPTPLASHGIVASVHPAFLLRGGGSLPKFRRDVGQAISIIEGTVRPKYKDSGHTVLNTVTEFEEVLARLEYTIWWHKALDIGPVHTGVDLETSGFSALEDYILCLGLGWEDTINYIVPEEAFSNPAYLVAIKRFMEWAKSEVSFVWHNGKFDIQFFWALGIDARVDEDTMLLSYTIDENKGLHDLEQVSNDAIDAPNWKGMLDAHKPSKNCSYALIPRPILYMYAGKDIAATIQTFHVIRKRVLADEHLRKAYYKVMIPASKTLGKIEYNGIAVDPEQIERNRIRLQNEMERIECEFKDLTIDLCKQTFNLNSPIQIANLLYDILRLEPPKGNRSTAKGILEDLPKHPAVKMILEYRKHGKQSGTYVVNLVDRVKFTGKRATPKIIKGHRRSDGRVHATYLIHGTVTGRLSSRKPNMQNPPRDAEIRGQFCAMRDEVARIFKILIEVDLNQAELRSLAELSGDQGLIDIYTDPDHPGLHHETSVAIFGDGYTGEHKMLAKAVNFGIVYGRSGASIAEAHDMPLYEGEEWIAKWAKRFPVAWDFIQACREAPLKGLALVTCFGRKRRFGVINRSNVNAVGNEASNFPHQSTASDITLVAHGRITEDPRYKGLLVNLIHDAGLHEVDDIEDVIDEQVALITYYMENEAQRWGLKKVPFKADAKIGTHWGKLKGYKVQGKYNFSAVSF